MTGGYCFDTNVFIQSWRNRYPPDIMPDFWEDIEALARKEIVFSPDEVRVELEKIDDDLFAWVKERKCFFRPISEDVQAQVRQILAVERFQSLLNTQKNRSMADPFVIAMARSMNATVVTEEQRVAQGKRVKIPDVCDALGIPCVSVVGFMRQMGMTFRRA